MVAHACYGWVYEPFRILSGTTYFPTKWCAQNFRKGGVGGTNCLPNSALFRYDPAWVCIAYQLIKAAGGAGGAVSPP